jgi:lipopolysaccharide transport system permease protein
LLSLVTYTLVFSGAVKVPNQSGSQSQFDYALFIFGGLIAFNLFSEMSYRAPSLLQEYSHFIKLTMFPAEMLPIISTLRATVYSSIGLVLVLVAELVLAGHLYWTSLLLPLWLIPFVALLIGMTWFLSAVGAFTRDVSYAMMTVAPLLMFATPVFFSREGLPPPLDLLIYLNIMTGYIEIVRDLVVFGRLPSGLVCLWTLVTSAFTFWGGYWFFIRNRDGIADVL